MAETKTIETKLEPDLGLRLELKLGPLKPGPPGIPVLKVTNYRPSFGKIPKIPV